ncbi:AAA family ATPase [Candidatus Berkiella aquae]|uniref:AAA family ATPase n=1 Tax=Candidatus Berkiella aquae TaxID=295108 RepID=A0A0Q9YZG5_9GAMM|nr:AAA family ATPase [Candidatus Berkiella aquae]MCS5711552.1 AAA family ATPase [Candidatus Berkiella aquae]
MAILEFTVKGYRSLQDFHLPLNHINVITGPNGCGKSNLYNSICLLGKSSEGHLAKTLALEGGMPSILWAGERKNVTRTKKPVRMILSVRTDVFSYELSLGLPSSSLSLFSLDPEIKEEYVWHGEERRRANTFFERQTNATWVMNQAGEREAYPVMLTRTESILSQLHEPHLYPELSMMRESMRNWRFYHHFRTDSYSPLRFPQVGVHTPVMSNDGIDYAAALQTIIEIGDEKSLHAAINDAFPGSRLIIKNDRSRFEVLLQQPGIKRPLEARELSDGTLRYLCLIAALLSPRPPEFLAINEPEMSLHPDLIEPLANLIYMASKNSQIWVTTHSQPLAEYLALLSKERPIVLNKIEGYTQRLQGEAQNNTF